MSGDKWGVRVAWAGRRTCAGKAGQKRGFWSDEMRKEKDREGKVRKEDLFGIGGSGMQRGI